MPPVISSTPFILRGQRLLCRSQQLVPELLEDVSAVHRQTATRVHRPDVQKRQPLDVAFQRGHLLGETGREFQWSLPWLPAQFALVCPCLQRRESVANQFWQLQPICPPIVEGVRELGEGPGRNRRLFSF